MRSIRLESALRLTAALLIASLLVWCKAETAYEKDPNVRIISTVEQFTSEIEESDSVWLLHVYSSITPKQAEAVSAVAKLMKGIFPVGAIDLDTYQDVDALKSKYSIRGSALLILGDDKRTKPFTKISTRDMDLQKLTDALVQAAGQTISERSRHLSGATSDSNQGSSDGGDVSLISTDASFADDVLNNPYIVMVAYTAPWCGHCKRLEPEWQQAAASLARQSYARNSVRMVWVDATTNPKLTAKYQVKGYPTIKIFPGTSDTKKTAADAKDYQGERTAAAMVQAVLDEVDRTGMPFEIPELTNSTILQDHCAGANHICILAGLPHIVESGAAGRRKYQETVGKVAKAFRSSMAFSFLWFQGSSQPELEASLELTFGFPAVVALSVDRKAYAVMRGAFTEKGMTSFLHSLTTGRQATVPLQTLPVVAAVEPWDGEDAAPVEEEFSLADILGDDEL